MFNTILKKKLSDNQVANIFINALFDSVDSGWGEISIMINEDPAFVVSPNINSADSGKFGLIVITANISLLESTFEVEQASRIEKLVFQKLAKIYGMGELEFENLVRSYQSFISRVNHPSKNMVYGMSKAVFHKYNLNNFQDEYFKRMQAPNPLFLKRMDEVMASFIWNWDAFFKKYKLS
jgi:hypothetical protein